MNIYSVENSKRRIYIEDSNSSSIKKSIDFDSIRESIKKSKKSSKIEDWNSVIISSSKSSD